MRDDLQKFSRAWTKHFIIPVARACHEDIVNSEGFSSTSEKYLPSSNRRLPLLNVTLSSDLSRACP